MEKHCEIGWGYRERVITLSIPPISRRDGFLELRIWPPSVNHVWQKTKTGRVYLSKAGRTFRTAVMAQVMIARAKGKMPKQPFTGALDVTVSLTPPDRRRRDIDNGLKALFDALTHAGVWRDDSQIKNVAVNLAETPLKGGRVEILISAMKDCGDTHVDA